MYNPGPFAQTDITLIHAAIEAARLAILVTYGPGGLEASHVPMLLDRTEGESGTLYGHVARANPQWRNADAKIPALAIFTGPDAYVSPSWYPSKAETGKVVPTWNYVAVHATGPVEFFDEAGRLRRIVEGLTEKHEAGLAKPWAVSDAPEEYLAQMLKGFVGFRLPIATLEGKWKLSQNKSAADRDGTAKGLEARGGDSERDIARLMRQRQ